MVAQKIQTLADNAEGLALLAQYLHNPKLIDELKAEAVKAIGFTEDEQKRAADGREAIRQGDALTQKLQSDRDALDKERLAHEENVKAFNEQKDAFSKNMEEVGTLMAEKDAAHADTDQRHAEARKKLDSDIAAHNNNMVHAYAKLDEEREKATAERQANAVEAARLFNKTRELQQKAEEFRALSVIK